MLLFSSFSYGQSVMGIDFGSSFETTKELLEKRFGKYQVQEKEGSLYIYNFKMGDFTFKTGDFHFQYSGDKSYLSEASFQYYSDKNDVEYMKGQRDYLYSLLKDKYADEYLEEFTNKQGFKCYKFGLNPVDQEKVLGMITLSRMKGNDGVERLYLFLDYLPIYFIDKASDF